MWRQTVQIAVEWNLPVTIFIFFSFKATENLYINKAINYHNKNNPLQIAKVSSQIPQGVYVVSHSIPLVYFSVSLLG